MYIYRERTQANRRRHFKQTKQARKDRGKQPEQQSSGDPQRGSSQYHEVKTIYTFSQCALIKHESKPRAGMSPIQTCGRRIYNFLLPFCFFDIQEMQERLGVAYDFFFKFYFKLHKSCRQELEQTFSQAFAMPSPDKTSDEGHVENQESRSDNGDDNNQNFGHVARTDLQVARFLTRRRSFA